jgi:hypothetical protein
MNIMNIMNTMNIMNKQAISLQILDFKSWEKL